MKKYLFLTAFLLTSILSITAQTVYPDYQDGKIYIKIKDSYIVSSKLDENPRNLSLSTLPFIEAIASKHQIAKLSKPFFAAKTSATLQKTYLLQFNDYNSVNSLIREIKTFANVEYAEKVPLPRTFLTPNDPNYSSQWNLNTINAAAAWGYFSSGSNVTVAIVDDAIERTHTDLSPNIWVNTGDNNSNGADDDGNGYIDDKNGYDVADNDNNPDPTIATLDHGTHVAGIVGASSNNSIGIASIGYSVKLMCVKSSNAPTVITNGYDGIVYAAVNRANVINMSWGGPGSSATEQNVINFAYSQGCIIVAAAGNDGNSTPHYPAAYTNVIAVASSNSDDTKSSFSCYGAWVDVTAPGNNIYSTIVGNGYGNKSGTSMASPLVAGLCGLMKSLNPSVTQLDIINCLKNNAVNINSLNPSYSGMLGTGRIDANAAMACIAATLNYPPTADFSANITNITAGGQVSFSDLSIYNPTSWSWSFAGGTPASSTSKTPPAIKYNTAGVYGVTLTATNSNGNNIKKKAGYITVNPATGCGAINYPAPSTWTLSIYAVDATNGFVLGTNAFGDKEKAAYFNTSSAPYTYVTGALIGAFIAGNRNPNKTVGIKIYDGTSGTPGAQIGATQNVTMATIHANAQQFSYTYVPFASPILLPVSKKYFVSVDISNLNWLGNPKDTLVLACNKAGQTTPSAIWEKQSDNLWYQTDGVGSWGLSASLYVHPIITDAPTVATYTASAISICAGQSINFDATGSTYEDTLLWVFSGGSPYLTSVVKPSVIYNTAGTYNAKLYVVGGGCSELDSMVTTITVKPNPTVAINASAVTICPGNSATLSASGTATSFVWSPSGGLNTTTGVKVIANPSSTSTSNILGTGSNGCSKSTNVTITVDKPTILVATVSNTVACVGTSINFDASQSANVSAFNWIFPGGTPSAANTSNAAVAFTPAGTYTITLSASNNCGSSNFAQKIKVNPLPVAMAAVSNTLICTGSSVNFDASASTNISTFNWTFPGGVPSTASTSSISVSFASNGIYTATLLTSNGCGSNILTQTIKAISTPTVQATVSSTTLCAGNSINFNASGTIDATSFSWTFPGGTPATATTSNVSVSFAAPATSTVSLVASNMCGSGNYSQLILINTCALGINESNFPSAAIYFDMAVNKVQVKLNNFKNNEHARFVLINSLGQTMMATPLNNLTETIDINGFANGVYIVGIFNGEDMIQTSRLIVQH